MLSLIKKITKGIISYFKDKKIVSHIRLSGIIGNVGKFKQGIDFSSQQEIIKKAFLVENVEAVAISINSPGGSPVQSHLIYSYIRKMAREKNVKVLVGKAEGEKCSRCWKILETPCERNNCGLKN